jgi:hypothetical protein
MPTNPDKYTDPELHDQIKEEVQSSDKGGAPGQWSARKAQFVASEYIKRGGGYTDEKDHSNNGSTKERNQDESQKSLSRWGEEDWQTKEGDGTAKTEDGKRKRYLPKKAWENMSEEDKQNTEDKKLKGGEEGKQFVSNAEVAKNKGKEVRENRGKNTDEDEDEDEDMEDLEQDEEEDDEYQERDNDDEDEEDKEDEAKGSNDNDNSDEETGQKRKHTSSSQGSSKKRKSNRGKAQKSQSNGKATNGTHGSKHDSTEEPAPPGSNDRLPKKGQRISWKALPGWVHGKVLEVVTTEKDMKGKHIKASKEDPRIAIESDSGKFCVHKPDNCYFED